MQKILFSELGLSPEILKAVAALGFEEASPIQSATIPLLLSGKDIVGQSQTGSGKTAAFAIPAIEKIDPQSKAVQILILCPTRELATQVADEVHKLIAYKPGIHAVPIYGGAPYDRQLYELKKGVQVVIGTPGRLIDHLNRGTLKLNELKMVILDEADRMLDMGFRDDIQEILDAMPEERQTVFFSATVSKQISDLIRRYARDPEHVKIEQKELSAPAIEQWYYEVHARTKIDSLIRIIDYHGFRLGIIFCNTQRMVDELADTLMGQGFSADRLHGGIAQAQRTRVMNKFKKSEFEFLVATDVAARGIDVDDLELVVNYDLPYDAEDYVHRIGRTGRAGKRGMAVTFVSGREIYKLQFIERFTRTKIRRAKLPTPGEIEEKRVTAMLEKIRHTLDASTFKDQTLLVDRLLEEGHNSTDIAAAALQMLMGAHPESPEPAVKAALVPPIAEEERSQRDSRDSRSPERPVRSRSERPERPARDVDRPPRAAERQPRFTESAAGDERTDTRPAKNPADKPLRPPSRGFQWVSMDIGKADGFGPREICDLIEDVSGLPGKSVGMIDLKNNESFVQVPETFAKSLSGAGNILDLDGREVMIRPIRAAGPKREGNFKPGHKAAKGGKKKW